MMIFSNGKYILESIITLRLRLVDLSMLKFKSPHRVNLAKFRDVNSATSIII